MIKHTAILIKKIKHTAGRSEIASLSKSFSSNLRLWPSSWATVFFCSNT